MKREIIVRAVFFFSFFFQGVCRDQRRSRGVQTISLGAVGVRREGHVPRMDLNEDRERRTGQLFSAEIRQDARAHTQPNARRHRGQLTKPLRDRANP